jgi:hypothetical protein
MVERRFSSHWWVMKSLCVVQGTNLCRVYNYHDSRACGYKRSVILPRIEGMVWEWDGWIWFGITLWYCVILCALCDPLCTFVDQTLCPFVPLWSYFVIYLNSTQWVVPACNFNLVNSMLIINVSSVGALLLTTIYLIYLVITLTYHLFPALAEYQP